MPLDESKDFWPPAAFIKHLSEKRDIPQHRAMANVGNFEVYSLDLTALKLNVNYFTPFIISTSLSGSAHKIVAAAQIEALLPELHEQVRRTTQAPFVVLVVGGKVEPESDDLIQRCRARSVAVLSRHSIKATFNAPDRDAAWSALALPLVKYLGGQQLSPYLPGRPAFGGRFFGRAEALSRAISGKLGSNLTIMGNRRIGKTSLLREIKGRMGRDNARLRTADIYGNNFNSAHEVVKELLEHLRPELARKLSSEPDLVDNLPAHISFIPEKLNEDVAVFIDELDHILEFDAADNYRLINLLRATFEHERCRIFFAGFRRVIDAKSRLDTPLYNFTYPVSLTSLTRNETFEMIVGPLSRLGISLPPQLPEAIMRETSGHPELIQMFCAKVVAYYTSHGRGPNVNELIGEIVEDDVFRQTVYSTFLKNTNLPERLLSYGLIARASGSPGGVTPYVFSLKDCDAVMKEAGMELSLRDLDTLAENLRIGGVIGTIPGQARRFKFAVPRLAEYCMAEDLEFAIRKTKEELATQPGPISLVIEPDSTQPAKEEP
jgi:hypothetical protein